jgi:hypothetical protein
MARYSHILKYLFLFSFFMLLCSLTGTDESNKVLVSIIKWKTTYSYPELPFEGSGFFREESEVPVFLTSIPLPDNFSKNKLSVKITPIQWAPFKNSKILTDITAEDVSDEPVYRIVEIRKKPYLEIEIIPFRVSEISDYGWEKLLQFSINISYSQVSKSLKLKSEQLKYSYSSRLAEGTWVKIGTSDRGIYKIPYSKLKDWGFSQPSKVQVYGNGGAMVPVDNGEERPDDLPIVSCLHTNDAIFFYSPGTYRWIWNETKGIFEHKLHRYSQKAFYFLSQTDEAIQTPVEATVVNEEVTNTTSTFDALYFHEEEDENILNSGNQWFGEKFNSSVSMTKNFEVSIPNIQPGSEAIFNTQVAGRSGTSQSFNISVNDNTSTSVNISTVSLGNEEGYYLQLADSKFKFPVNSGTINVKYQYSNSASTSIGWIDYFTINARGNLTLANGPINFRDHTIVGPLNITSFEISDSGEGTIVWNVTNPVLPVKMPVEINSSKASFKDSSYSIKDYIAFKTSMSLSEPEFIEKTQNQNFHNTEPVDMIIVAPPEFTGQAQRLADLHNKHSGLNVMVADRDQIYNEFSWGHPDPGAIRAFVKMLYDRAGEDNSKAPQLLLLFGDGSYDNRNIDNTPAAPLPTYQSDNSIEQKGSYVTDDFFGFLDDNEGKDPINDRLDIGIGRFPVSTLEQAANAVSKTEAYLISQDNGKWRTNLTFIADDGNGNIHMRDADRLTQKINLNYPMFDINKIYLDSYQLSTGISGNEYPEANEDIEQAISDGTLILNYTGHGSENNLAHEKIITKSDIAGWSNKNRLPLFVTATCEFSRFDNHYITSAGEEVFLTPNGGGIALLSTTRIVLSSLNFTLNNAFYNHAFEYDEEGDPLRLGEMIRRTKLESGSNINKLSFTLLGDPALRLIYPPNNVATIKLNDKETGDKTDTIKALSHNTIMAQIKDHLGNILDDFNGSANIMVFDKAVDTQSLGNGSNEPFEYQKYSNILFKGTATVTNGEFEVEFVVPQDIRYNFDTGRISYYALSEDGKEAAGAYNNIVIGGICNNVIKDDQGPEIEMYLNYSNFKDGNETGPRPMLYARLFDESGINTSGIGIGHSINLVIDGNTSNPTILNTSFTADIDNYKKGEIAYQLSKLDEGEHYLTLKVWDNYNNSSTATLTFRVTNNHGINVRKFTTYPNPVSPGDDVYFSMETDAANSVISVIIQFVNMAGAVTGTAKDEIISSENLIGPYKLPMEGSGWNYSGVCFVRFILKTENGQKTSVVAKLLPTR